MNDSSPDTSGGGLAVTVAAIALASTVAWLLGPDTPDRRQAIGFAAATCLFGSVAAWAASLRPAGTAAGRAAVPLAAMTLRLAPALVALAWLQADGARLRAAGAGELLVAFYLAALGADVARIIIGGRNSGPRPRGGAGV
ncbi:MAG: hypothetical protein ACKOBP_06065 [Planctomycetia bacterium]